MSLHAAPRRVRIAGFVLGLSCAVLVVPPSVQADHEVSDFPSFYPQEFPIEPLDPEGAARGFASKTDPFLDGNTITPEIGRLDLRSKGERP